MTSQTNIPKLAALDWRKFVFKEGILPVWWASDFEVDA
jgi:hypothetical protein